VRGGPAGLAMWTRRPACSHAPQPAWGRLVP
jgi:hypothetical protein